MNIEYEVQYLQDQIEHLEKKKSFLLQHRIFFESRDIGMFESMDLIHLTRCKHEDTLAVIRYFGGKWSKTYENERVHYQRDEGYVSIYGGEPPPSCRIVEEEVKVPARKEIRRRIICNEPQEAVIA